MFSRSRRRFGLVIVLLTSLLEQQVAVAAFACPGRVARRLPAAAPSAHCAAMAAEQPAAPQPLCEKHCAPDQTLPSPFASASALAPALEPVWFAPVLAAAVPREAHRLQRSLVQSQAPPRLQYCRLLI